MGNLDIAYPICEPIDPLPPPCAIVPFLPYPTHTLPPPLYAFYLPFPSYLPPTHTFTWFLCILCFVHCMPTHTALLLPYAHTPHTTHCLCHFAALHYLTSVATPPTPYHHTLHTHHQVLPYCILLVCVHCGCDSPSPHPSPRMRQMGWRQAVRWWRWAALVMMEVVEEGGRSWRCSFSILASLSLHRPCTYPTTSLPGAISGACGRRDVNTLPCSAALTRAVLARCWALALA